MVQSKNKFEDMENLPVEILEVIFHHFSSLTDVQNCYKTCVRWRNLIAKMFRDKRMYFNFESKFCLTTLGIIFQFSSRQCFGCLWFYG